ncbi:formate dehydrogenase accessory protein FdhE [Texcoconibacillus texcoconensis]|uniref:FdhE protein n=1 Tax=Texcoconibacillus texcoconensis TaxID=1095777 RepID=A0A840QNB6_9BACI|nr:formate dehydrogenase accessory protein FdhE [Texcoconibacillus texcoconensis]MBB5172833.1 FdhE protein [Texcoconibacillus texcoconensis]
MKQNVVTDEYLALQRGVIERQQEAKSRIQQQVLEEIKQWDDEVLTLPVVPQSSIPFNSDQYQEVVNDMIDYLKETTTGLEESLNQLQTWVKEAPIKECMKRALEFDTEYFLSEAEKHDVSPWMPHYIAEQALRPFLQVVAEHLAAKKLPLNGEKQCPCCGEPARLATLEKSGEKWLACPRCEMTWQQKRLVCIHCQYDNHDSLSYITVEEDEIAHAEVCSHCHKYLKVIDKRKTFVKKSTALLDLETIHLDFIVQEEGYKEARDDDEGVS